MSAQDRATELLEGFREGLTGYATSSTIDHAYIHRGLGHVVPGITGSIAAGGTYKFSFKTPKAETNKYIHWRPTSVYGIVTAFTAEVYRGSTSISGGTDEAIENLNDNLTDECPSLMQSFKKGVTVGADGTRIQIIAGGAGGAGSVNEGGGGGADHERVLLPDTDYSVTLTNRSGSTASIAIYEFFWYEEDGYTA